MEEEFFQHCRLANLKGVNDCLSRGVDVNTITRNWSGSQMSGLMVACERGNSAIMSRLVQVPGLDINYQDRCGLTAAHLASMRGHTECVRILAETGRVDWYKAGSWYKSGWTPLYCAVSYGHIEIVDIIMDLGLGLHSAAGGRKSSNKETTTCCLIL